LIDIVATVVVVVVVVAAAELAEAHKVIGETWMVLARVFLLQKLSEFRLDRTLVGNSMLQLVTGHTPS
jgi:hypothetical protein